MKLHGYPDTLDQYKSCMTKTRDLVETTWLSRYLRPIEITYDQVKEFIGNEFRKYLIEDEYRINAKPSTSGNSISDKILERIHQALGNIVRTFDVQQTYVDKNDPCPGILDTATYTIFSTNSRKML